MVKRALLPAALLPALFLAGCSFFTASLFPGYLAQTDKAFDLGSEIDGFLTGLGSADYRWYSQPFVLTTGAGADYGGVLIEIDSLPNKLMVLVDPAGGMHSFSDPGFNRRHLTDNSGNFVVGKVSIDPSTMSVVASSIDDNDFPGISFNSRNYLFWTESMYPNQVKYAYATGWPVGTETIVDLGDYGFELRGLFIDPLASGREVILVLFNYNYNQVYVIFTPSTGWAGGGSLATPLATNAASPRLTFSDTDAGNVIYTRKGIVLADYDGLAVLKDFQGNDTGKSLDLGRSGEARVAFDVEGDTFYVFKPEDQMLYRGNTGW